MNEKELFQKENKKSSLIINKLNPLKYIISKKKINIINIPIGKYWIIFSFNSTTLIFNIITTNKNNTEIAPIYTTKNNMAINSTCNNNNKKVDATKANIK